MAKFCERCGKKVSFFGNVASITEQPLCGDCKKNFITEKSAIEKEIKEKKTVSNKALEFLNKLKKSEKTLFYSRIYFDFEKDKELDEFELETLQKLQESLNLTNKEVFYDERVKPYIYVHSIKKEGTLPVVQLENKGEVNIIFKKGELLHHADEAELNEMRSVSVGYKRGSRGVNLRIAKGINYRIGGHRGHVVKEDRLVPTSQGFLFLTNQRLFLVPESGKKQANIPLQKIFSYQCYENGVEIYKEGREKGFFFKLSNSSSAEIYDICLSHLLENQ